MTMAMNQVILFVTIFVSGLQAQIGLPLYDNGFDYGPRPMYNNYDYVQPVVPPPPVYSPSSLNSPSRIRQTLTCGQTRENFPSSRIVGGRKAMENEFPWQVSIEMNKHDDKESRNFCGGAVIDEQWILTAAHCVQGMKQEDLELDLGTTDLSNNNQTTTIKFDDIIIHADYDNVTMRNDIALVRTQRRIPLDTRSSEVRINTICLPQSSDEFSGRVTVTGFGFKEEDGKGSNRMRATDVLILPDQSCQESYSSFDPTIMLCAGWPEGGKDACQGDSGGPLVQRQEFTDNTVLVGIVSYGKGCGRENSPGVYTRVSAYADWIMDRMMIRSSESNQ